MKNTHFYKKIDTYRYEFLLFALLMLIFNKIFFPSKEIYLMYVWPFNMFLISVACFGIFINQSRQVNILRNILSIVGMSMPFLFIFYSTQFWFLQTLSIFFIIYYVFIFSVLMNQIVRAKEVGVNVIIGAACGFMLLSMIALFSYLAVENNFPKSFHNISHDDLAEVYNQLSYFSLITLTSIGFGDIYPITSMSRLLTAFFGMVGQFYMVAVVGIVISKFTSK